MTTGQQKVLLTNRPIDPSSSGLRRNDQAGSPCSWWSIQTGKIYFGSTFSFDENCTWAVDKRRSRDSPMQRLQRPLINRDKNWFRESSVTRSPRYQRTFLLLLLSHDGNNLWTILFAPPEYEKFGHSLGLNLPFLSCTPQPPTDIINRRTLPIPSIQL